MERRLVRAGGAVCGAGNHIVTTIPRIPQGREDTPRMTDDFLTLADLAHVGGVSLAFAIEASEQGFLSPDKKQGTTEPLYRRRLSSWLGKLWKLRQAGARWEVIRAWTLRRWEKGNEQERRWPVGYAHLR